MRKLVLTLVLLASALSTSLKVPSTPIQSFNESDNKQISRDWYEANITMKTIDNHRLVGRLFTPQLLAYILDQCTEYSLKPSIIMSQMLLESRTSDGNRLSVLVRESNNVLGIKTGVKARSVGKHKLITTEYIKGRRIVRVHNFSKFNTKEDCIDAYFRIVKNHIDPETKSLTPKMFRRYATNPRYKQLIKRLAKSNNFYKLDKAIVYSL